MSRDTWIAEFYPVEAKDCPEGFEVEHSLRKWQGYRIDNLRRHGLEYPPIYTGSSTCAMCLRCESDCTVCIGYKANSRRCDGARSPFEVWVIDSNPEPMIRWLEITIEYQQKALKCQLPLTRWMW